MKKYLMLGFSIVSSILLLGSCEGTWIMYDTSQKDHLYMETLPTASKVSFALTSDLELSHDVVVRMMGMPSAEDRHFKVEYLEPSVSEIVSGEQSQEVYKAQPGTDFEAADFVLPAGAVEARLTFILKRTASLKEKYASLRFRIVEDDNFIPMAQDSTDLDAIVSSEYEVLFNDGDPVCPVWWDASTGSVDLRGWHRLIGKFYVDKYWKFLELFHDMEQSNPVIFEQMVDKYGYNLDKPDIPMAFFQTADPAVWATYVLIPLYNYFKELYKADTDHPNVGIDTFVTSATGQTSGEYWLDPIGQLK